MSRYHEWRMAWQDYCHADEDECDAPDIMLFAGEENDDGIVLNACDPGDAWLHIDD